MIFSSASNFKSLGLIAVLSVSAPFAVTSFAQQAPKAQPSEKAAEDLGKLQPFIDAKNWEGAINLLNGMLRYAVPNSYDQAIAQDIISKIYLQKGDYTQSIQPMEKAYHLGESMGYFEPRTQLDRLYYLAQLYYQEATNTKVREKQKEYFTSASTYIDVWLKRTPSPTQEARLFYASLLYNEAVMDPDAVDQDLIKKAQVQVQDALASDLHPKESFYILYLATLQQQGDIKKTAEILELLAKQYPSKGTYWQQLMATYANMAMDPSNPQASLDNNYRAIITIERAQKLGFMDTPKDNYNLVGIYFNIGQFAKATELLYKGLRDGSIENDIKKWELLAYSYQQVNKEFQAIDVLKEATKAFPKAGQLDNQIAQIYYSLNKSPDAYRHLKLAVEKGNLEKPGTVYYFQAYVCFELLKYDEALVAIDNAAKHEDSRDSQLPRLRQAITDAIKERERATEGATVPSK